ncbi:MAG: SDR family oxidoreductase [Chlorobiaceae bacterium]|jgi:uncharacterized protein YbjT (DUF2867 family)|nr:SDR family oxidoreductase [Chlorobiaceae bacterium]
MDRTFKGTVLVVGATGRTGQWIVRRLEEHHIPCRLFVRSSDKAVELFGKDVENHISTGSIENAEEIKSALEHADAVICAIGSSVTVPGAPPPSAIDRDGVIRLATLAKQKNIRKFILVSSLAVTKPDHPLNKYGNVLTMKLAGEDAVRELFAEKGYSYTILRPGGLLDGPPLLHELRFDTGDRLATGAIQRSDVAEVAVLSLFMEEAHNSTFELIQTDEKNQTSLRHFFSQLPSGTVL